MFEVKQNDVSYKVPIRMLSSIDGIQGVTGLTGASVNIAIARADGTSNTYAASSLTLTELTGGAFSNSGSYQLTLPAYATAILGPVMVSVVPTNSSARVFIGIFNVVANLESDVYSGLAALATAASLTSVASNVTAIKAKTDNLPTDPADESLLEAAITAAASPLATAGALATLAGNVTSLLAIHTGRWKIHTSGTHANRLVLYASDNTTILYKFDLLDGAGLATSTTPYERVPA